MRHIKISYIIITWNGLDYLKRLLQSMANQLKRTDIEVVLCDNGSTDGTAAYIQTQYPIIKFIYLSENRGVAYARNRCIEQATGKYLFIIDNDLELTDEAVETLEHYLDTHPKVGLVAPSLLYPDHTLQGNAKYYPGLVRKIKNVLFPTHRSTDYMQQYIQGEPFEPEYVIGACQLIRSEAADAVGLLDEHIFYGPEDADYCLRIRDSGWKVMCIPSIQLVHHCQRRTTKHPFSAMGRNHLKALVYFYWKYKKL